MPHHKSAEKRLRTNAKSRATNRAAKSRCRTLEKRYRGLLESGAKEDAQGALLTVQKALDQAKSRGILKAETVSRKKSRLMKALNQASS
jgi:small subunit ribosomal protein S20